MGGRKRLLGGVAAGVEELRGTMSAEKRSGCRGTDSVEASGTGKYPHSQLPSAQHGRP
jgi:hypothetical protein